MKARIFVTLKPDVLDPQGQAIFKALERMGFHEASDVRVGKVIELNLKGGDSKSVDPKIREVCAKLLSNPVIEDTRYEFTE